MHLRIHHLSSHTSASTSPMPFRSPALLLPFLFFALFGVVAGVYPDVDYKDITVGDRVIGRLYKPKTCQPDQKLPFLFFVHGGAFILFSPFMKDYDNYTSAATKKSNIIVFSIDYRYYIPKAYDDSWETFKWVASHRSGSGPEPWLNTHVDFDKVYLAGDSAGANICHNILMRLVGGGGPEESKADGVDIKVQGLAMLHPYFWGSKPVGTEPTDAKGRSWAVGIWLAAIKASPPESSKVDEMLDDVRDNPLLDPKLGSLPVEKLLVIYGDEDVLKDRGQAYVKALEEKGWPGKAKVMSSHGTHCFFLAEFDKDPEKMRVFDRFNSFISGEWPIQD
ncbi:probable carboxylesterase 12 [Diospyros lotus]|uniref:probable carboxylesterase 12 n=1 Tax=Diospyros lotus TaxID=55363 RepID=UPI00225A201A|nr:probable carboxylesterase 12 [Diospyros lotus]